MTGGIGRANGTGGTKCFAVLNHGGMYGVGNRTAYWVIRFIRRPTAAAASLALVFSTLIATFTVLILVKRGGCYSHSHKRI